MYVGEHDIPYAIVKTWLIDPAPGRQSLKMLLLEELRPVDASTVEVLAQDVVSLSHGFNKTWGKHGLDAETELNAEMRQMHLEAVRRLAAKMGASEQKAFEVLRGARGPAHASW